MCDGVRPLVSVVDDDESVRESLPDLLRELGFAVAGVRVGRRVPRPGPPTRRDAYPRRRHAGHDRTRAAAELTRRRQNIPIVFITAQGDESVRPRMLDQGAVECLFKPFSETALLEAVNAALRASDLTRFAQDDVRRCRTRYHPCARQPIVFVVDDDISVRESLELLIRCAGWQPETFASAQEFLSRPRVLAPSCLVLDVDASRTSTASICRSASPPIGSDMPIIFITGYGDVPMTVQAMKAGAVEFLTKPFSDEVLLSAIRHAIERSRAALDHEAEMRALRELLRVAQPSRTRGDGAGRLGPAEQAGRRRARHQRDHGQGAPRPGDAKDEGRLARRPGQRWRQGSACRLRRPGRSVEIRWTIQRSTAPLHVEAARHSTPAVNRRPSG